MIYIDGWEIAYHDENLQAKILSMPAGVLARYLHCVDRMIRHGPDLGMPHTKAMKDGLFEMRLKSKEGLGRVFYAVLPERKIMMLHQFMKKSDKTPPKELKLARLRLKENQCVDT